MFLRYVMGLKCLLVLTGALWARPNVLFISIDDLRNDLGVLGVEHAHTPRLDAFAGTARVFSHHYVQVPTCGASRAALLSGRYPRRPADLGNQAVFSGQTEWGERSLPAQFRGHGYRTLALGKVSHHPGGRGGSGWQGRPVELEEAWNRHWVPEGPWAHPEAMMHGYADGVARTRGESPPLQAVEGGDESLPDGRVAAEAVATLAELAEAEEPWFFAVGFFKPHLPFAAPRADFDRFPDGVPDLPEAATARPDWPSGWHRSGEFRNNYGHAEGRDPETDPAYARELRLAYAACVSYVDRQIGRVLDALEEHGLAGNTVVVVWSDHGFLLGEHAIWGKHCLYEHSLRAPLMIRHPGLPRPGEISAATVETVDVFPTLLELCGLPRPEGLDGASLLPHLRDPAEPAAKPAFGFWTGGARSVRDQRWRLIAHEPGGREPFFELFDLENDPYETRNFAAERPAELQRLQRLLESVPRPVAR